MMEPELWMNYRDNTLMYRKGNFERPVSKELMASSFATAEHRGYQANNLVFHKEFIGSRLRGEVAQMQKKAMLGF